MLYVCSLSKLGETVENVKAQHVITVIDPKTHVPTPPSIDAQNHLVLGFNDINHAVDGLIEPTTSHVAKLVDYAKAWDQTSPIVIHCWAGISRSTATAFTIACTLNDNASETDLANQLRANALSATPNARIVALADEYLKRDGRMIAAAKAIGRGADAFEGTPFRYNYEAI